MGVGIACLKTLKGTSTLMFQIRLCARMIAGDYPFAARPTFVQDAHKRLEALALGLETASSGITISRPRRHSFRGSCGNMGH